MNALYVNNTLSDVTDFHSVIVEAINNNGQFDDDFADIFTLVKCPPGSTCQWALYFYDDTNESEKFNDN